MKKISFFILALLLCSLFLLPVSAQEQAVEELAQAESLGFADTLSAFITENADTLLGLLTLVGSLLVAFLYKTGLLPLLRSGLSALGELLGKSRDLTERFTKDAGERIARIEARVAPVADALSHGEEMLASVEQKIAALTAALEKSEKDRLLTSEVLRTETELFYELLSSVNLPEAQKESMTESFYRLKRILEAAE